MPLTLVKTISKIQSIPNAVLLVNGDMDNGVKAGFDSRFQKMFPRSNISLSREELTSQLKKRLIKRCNPLLVDVF
jgi:hypothetical protein